MKTIPSNNYIVRTFQANKSWDESYTFLTSSNSSYLSIDLATAPPPSWNTFVSGTSAANPNGVFKQTLYDSVQNLFYNTGSNDGSGSVSRAILRYPLDKGFYPTGSAFYVVNVSQQVFGEGINPGTFKITSTVGTGSIYDDGEGRLVSNVSTSSVIGNIFYNLGIAVIQQDTGSFSSSLVTNNGLYLSTGSTVNVLFQSIYTIYEHEVVCTADPGEFNYSNNPTMGNLTLSGSTFSGPQALDLYFSGSLPPYFTTIGLYNDQRQLVALGKFPKPLKLAPNIQQTVIVRFDI
jgi:hypothetical protein